MTAATRGVALTWLLDGIATLPAGNAGGATRVADLTLDSREARAGSLFFALGGGRTHGLAFAAEALARGASVVLWDPEGAPPPGTGPELAGAGGEAMGFETTGLAAAAARVAACVAPVANLKKLVGRIADRFFGWPSSHLRIVGITGTNGKTTCAYLLTQCLLRLESQAAYIGTLGWGRIEALAAQAHTTPDVVTVHRQLAELRAQGVRDVAMEVSSHALDQGRVDAVRFHSAAFTNLTRDHLDYHASMHAYGAAKARLFERADLKQVVINIGDAFGRELARRVSGRAPLTAVWLGAGGAGWIADRSLHAEDVATDLTGLSMTVRGSAGTCRVSTRLLGRFNAENSLIVLACLVGLDVPLAAACAALAECTAPPGRMEMIAAPQPDRPLAVIDYAHTPDALANALNALREHCRGTLWCVFGCGGDRDPGKRALMGAVADELADRIIITDDNPRTEDPETITGGIMAGIASGTARVMHDRSEAIATALAEAGPGDIVLIAGKGHEEQQILGHTRRTFSDRREALRHLSAGGMLPRPP
jgi:UDP-N-acetylmuramoyl-L-alanyl-D-glutamate--2,6-diaminopimelate ligase